MTEKQFTQADLDLAIMKAQKDAEARLAEIQKGFELKQSNLEKEWGEKQKLLIESARQEEAAKLDAFKLELQQKESEAKRERIISSISENENMSSMFNNAYGDEWKSYDADKLDNLYSLVKQVPEKQKDQMVPPQNQGVSDGLDGLTTEELVERANREYYSKKDKESANG